jgi:peptidoglycan/LPS O-acetylase OafA/YrhL
VDARLPQRARVGGLSERFFRPGLTGIRALAATWVMLFHLSALYGPAWMGIGYGDFLIDISPLITIGWIGVNLFFVLSGFLLTTHLLEQYDPAREKQVLARYAKARFLRVFPAYWTQIAIFLIVAWTVNRAAPDWVRFLPLHLPMMHNLTLASNFAINAVYWTLPIELGFYLCLPALIKIIVARGMEPRTLLRRTLVLLLVVMALGLAYRTAAFRAHRPDSVLAVVWAITQIPGSLDQFVMGMLAAVLLRCAKAEDAWGNGVSGAQASTLLFLLGMAGTIAMMHWVHHTPDYWNGSRLPYFWYTMTAAFLAMVVLSIALSSGLTRVLFENAPVVWLGTISYSIYLWHYPVSKFVALELGGATMPRVQFGLFAFAATVAVSAISYYAVERPFMRRGAGGSPLGDRIKND